MSGRLDVGSSIGVLPCGTSPNDPASSKTGDMPVELHLVLGNEGPKCPYSVAHEFQIEHVAIVAATHGSWWPSASDKVDL